MPRLDAVSEAAVSRGGKAAEGPLQGQGVARVGVGQACRQTGQDMLTG